MKQINEEILGGEKMSLRKKGQSALEYALIIGAVVAALVAINAYMQKGVQGKLKESTDQIGRQFDPTTFTTAWRNKDLGETKTQELRNSKDGSTKNIIKQTGEVVRDEYESFGIAPTQKF